MREIDWPQRHLESCLTLSPEIRKKCVEAFRAELNDSATQDFQARIRHDPATWWAAGHMFWGMSVRNFFRTECKVPDDLLPDFQGGGQNWDHHYIGIVEVAVKAGIYDLLPEDQRI